MSLNTKFLQHGVRNGSNSKGGEYPLPLLNDNNKKQQKVNNKL